VSSYKNVFVFIAASASASGATAAAAAAAAAAPSLSTAVKKSSDASVDHDAGGVVRVWGVSH